MPESFEKYFTQKEEEKSPEEIKEKKALALAEEIKEIKERMEKEGETLEGYQRIIELSKKIKEMYEEKREFISERAKGIYQSLKETSLWDEGKKQWNGSMDKEGKWINSDRYSEDQLVGVLAETVAGNLEEAKGIYQSLKETSLWDEEKKQWNSYMDEKGKLIDSDRDSGIQLLGVLAEAVAGNLEEAKGIYQSLKETPLWDKEKKQWNGSMDKGGKWINSNRLSMAQLLGVLAEAVAGNLEEAKEIYQSLKETSLWDEEKKQWNGSMDKGGKLINSDRYSKDQLLGVLAEAVAGNLEEAKEIYQSLLKTSLWDEEKKQWNGSMDKGGELKSSSCHSDNQLLGVLAEAVDEKGEEFIKFLTEEK